MSVGPSRALRHTGKTSRAENCRAEQGRFLKLGAGHRVLIAAVLLFVSTFAVADNVLVVGGPVTGTTLTIKDSALTALNSGWASGVTAYIDPYHGTLNGQAVTLFCIDPNHLDNSNPNGYPVTVSPGGTGNSTLQELNVSNSGVVPGTG